MSSIIALLLSFFSVFGVDADCFRFPWMAEAVCVAPDAPDNHDASQKADKAETRRRSAIDVDGQDTDLSATSEDSQISNGF